LEALKFRHMDALSTPMNALDTRTWAWELGNIVSACYLTYITLTWN
jgi:hypothetical protein